MVAPPGCGKTELLAQRADRLIEALLPHQRILALTFSNRAKANLDERLLTVMGTERKRRHVTVRNFHGHAAEILRSHGRTLALDPAFTMPGKRTQSSAVEPYVEGLSDADAGRLRERIETDLRTPKQRPYSDAQVLAWLHEQGIEPSTEIETARQASATLFYDDLLRHAQRLLRVPEIAFLYQNHYGAVLVDEFQDLSPQQLDIALRSCSRSRTFVGDPLQGIYSWTGARPVQVERQLRRICGEPEGLGVSYRSSPHVLTLLNAVAATLGGQPLAPDDPGAWFEGGITAGTRFATGQEEADFLVETAARILDRQASSTIGVISRSEWRRKPVDKAFSDSPLVVCQWDLAVDNPEIVRLLRDTAAKLGQDYDLNSLRSEVEAQVDPADAETQADIGEAFIEIERLTAALGGAASALAQLRDPDDDDASIGPGVHLLNAHTGKGQQFDWVFMPGIEKGHIPSFLAKPSEMDEERRILLVMFSRARHGVVLTRADSLISKKGNPYPTDGSPWLSDLVPALSARREALCAHIDRLPSN